MKAREISPQRRMMAERLREIRMNASYTQERFAELLGISTAMYKKLESGRSQITLDEMRTLHKKLNVSADYLIFGELQGIDDTWKKIQNSSEGDKLMLLMRLVTYFAKAKENIYMGKNIINQSDKGIQLMLDLIKNNEG